MTDRDYWSKCSGCKDPIGFRTRYFVCSVSTCTRKRTGMVFCSVPCWEAHLPMMRHREAYAVEQTSPSPEEYARELAAEAAAASAPSPSPAVAERRVVSSAPAPESSEDLPDDILIVVSKLKKYVKARSGFNTSDNVLPRLSRLVRELCDEAIRHAGQDGRKTVMDRDFRSRI